MRIIVDTQLVAKIKEGFKSLELEEFAQADSDIVLGWPSLFELLEIPIMETFPAFTSDDLLYLEIIAALAAKPHPERLEHLFDQVFVHCLNWVRSQKEVHPNFLTNRIRQKLDTPEGKLFSKPLRHYERVLMEEPYLTIHDITLNLAWDRVCVLLGIIFEYLSQSKNVHEGLEILRNCLVESFQHITKDKKTVPGFFRMMEALYSFQMREERLQLYTDAEWQILSQSVHTLRPREFFLDIPYIDHFMFHVHNTGHLPRPSKVLTMDSWDKVNKSITLARYLIDLLKMEDHDWSYDLQAAETISLG